ncbi:Oxidoreductase htatip2 [Coemansia guatemalensis]|uniref:Oxidoreductase htatip2 n=1 Tax=Coemansia guatemalensis TaxID=2761395 RepID=A0A9W8I1Z7_9FUNG|nr:Oxidoreductase htatip2 [Coemansia guatemalensis]
MTDTAKISADDKIVLGEAFTKSASEFKARAPGKSALVLGGTGESGSEVVKHLMASGAFDKVTVFARRPVEYTGPNAETLVYKPINLEDTEQMERDFAGHTHAFNCLGTTRAKSGKEGFYKVDHDYILNATKACKAAEIEHYSICSSAGADKNSMFLYTKTKGEVNSEIEKMGFPRVSIFLPGMLMCDRKEARPLEKIASYVMPALNFVVPNRLCVPTSTVGWAMVNNAFKKVDTPILENISNLDMVEAFKKGQQ